VAVAFDPVLRPAQEAAHKLIGAFTVVGDLSWEHGEASVLRVATPDRELIVKQHRQSTKFDVEHRAYARWARRLPDVMAQLAAVSTSDQLLVLEVAPGDHPTAEQAQDPELHERAGRVLRRLHDVEPARVIDDYRAQAAARLDLWLTRAREGLLDPRDVDYVRQQIRSLSMVETVVACHMDWQPRNWLIADDGGFYVIDFEHGRYAPWYEDLLRLWAAEWSGRPGLVAAFERGYGRAVTEQDAENMRVRSALGDITTIIWAHEHADLAYEQQARNHLQQLRRESQYR
jgi:thiamine kinase-like enzyme